MNVTGGARHERRSTASGSVMSCGDHKEQKHSDCDKVGELVVCSRAVPGVTESTGCAIGQGRQLVGRCARECYRRRGMVYQR